MDYEKVDELIKMQDAPLLKAITAEQKRFYKILQTSKFQIRKEISELTNSLSLRADPQYVEMDLIAIKSRLFNIEQMEKQLLIEPGLNWATDSFMNMQKISLEDMNRFERIIGSPLSVYTEIDSIQLKTALESYKGMLIDLTDTSRKALSDMFTEHVMAGVGNKQSLIQKVRDYTPASSALKGKKVNNFVNMELMRINRMTSAIEQKDYNTFRFSGPLDIKTEKICVAQIGFIRTRAEWLAINPNVFTYGLHMGCRHKLVPVKKAWLHTDEEKTAFDNKSRLLYADRDKEFVQKSLRG